MVQAAREKGVVGGEKEGRQAQASLLERWPIQQRSAKAREATCHTSAPQSHYSNPTLVPYFMIECQIVEVPLIM